MYMRRRYYLVLFAILLIALLPNCYCAAQEEHHDIMVHTAFYGYIPEIAGHVSHATIGVVALEDNTKVTIYDLAGGSVLKEATLNKLQVLEYNVTKGDIYFKIVASKPVAAFMTGGQPKSNVPGNECMDTCTSPPCGPKRLVNYWGYGLTFYPSTDGKGVGKEFIFYNLYPTVTIYSVEKAKVEIYDSKGIKVQSFTIPANWASSIKLKQRQVYRIVSTGKILVYRGPASDAATALVDVNSGELVGKVFMGSPAQSWSVTRDPQGNVIPNSRVFNSTGSYVIFAYEPAEVKVYDLSLNRLIASHKLNSSGEFVYYYGVPCRDLKFVSTGLVSIWIGGTFKCTVYSCETDIFAMGDDLWFAGGVGGKEFNIFGPNGAIVFALLDDTQVKVDGSSVSLSADEYYKVSPGHHTISSNKPVIVEVIALGQHLDSFAQYLVTSPLARAEAPKGKGGGGGLGSLPLIGGVVAIVIIVVVVVVLRKRRGP